MGKNDPHFRLRIPEGLKARVEAEAAAENRSINAQIVYLLEFALNYLDRSKRVDEEQPFARLKTNRTMAQEEPSLETPEGRLKLLMNLTSTLLIDMQMELAVRQGNVSQSAFDRQKFETATQIHEVLGIVGSLGTLPAEDSGANDETPGISS